MDDITENKLIDFLRALKFEQIQENFHSQSFHRGLRYYENEHVKNVVLEGEDKCVAQVFGQKRYSVTIRLTNAGLHSHCSCPVRSGCKHIAAALIYCVHHSQDLCKQESIPDFPDMQKVEEHLQSLSKEELIRLVLEFSPAHYKERITLNNLGKEQSKRVLDHVASQFRLLTEDNELLYSPDSFESAMVELFEKLRGIWETLPEETADLIINSLHALNGLIDDGYLDDYYDDRAFEGYDLSQVIRAFIISLPFDQKMNFIWQVENLILNMDSVFCEPILMEREQLFSKEDIPDLKTWFLNKIAEKDFKNGEAYFKLLSDHLSLYEKERILKELYPASEYLTLELVNLYKGEEKKDEAIRVIEDYLQKASGYFRNTEELYAELLRLKNELGVELEGTAREALNNHGSISLLEMIVALLPEKQDQYEQILMRKNAHQYLNYLEKHQRISEALLFVEDKTALWEDDKYKFFVKHLDQCPKEAKSYFTKRIKSELLHTGNRHYYAIADTLKALKKIDPNKAAFIAQNIRNEYKRRKNLLQVIKDI